MRIEKTYSNNIHLSASLLGNLIENIIDLSKIELGKMQIVKKVVSLESIVESTKKVFALSAINSEVTIRYVQDDNLPDKIKSDEVKLVQILVNLVSNAVKFSRGQVEVRISFIENSQLVFSVKYNGPGIEPGQIDLVFQPFEQLESGRSKNVAGTGLGLAITRQLVDLLKGTIDVNSTIGEGTEFIVTLPVQVQGKESLQGKPSLVQFSLDDLILVVEDNKFNRDILSTYLLKKGMTVIEADNGEVAVEMAREYSPSMILIDIHMPRLDGFEATRRIRAHECCSETPIVALSADTLTDTRSEADKAGIDYFLTKPIDFGHLDRILEYYLRQDHTEGFVSQ